MISAYQAKYFAHELTRRHAGDDVGRLSQSLFDASVDLNPHQIDAALFALRNPLQEGVLLADEVGLGKTIEAALVLCQYWAERRRRLLIICPASLRKQWAQELAEKFALPATIVDRSYLRAHGTQSGLLALQALAGKQVVILSYAFAVRLEAELRAIAWDAVVIDEAHKLRNAHRASNRTGQALRRALAGRKKLLLTATPLQNSLMELYGLSTLIDEHLFGDASAFRQKYVHGSDGMHELRERLAAFAKRTLRRDVLEYIQYTGRHTITQPFEPTAAEQQLYDRVSEFLQRDDSFALPVQQRHLISLILRKLLASSPSAIAGTLTTIRDRLQQALDAGLSVQASLAQDVASDEGFDDEYLEEAEAEGGSGDETPAQDEQHRHQVMRAEMDELTGIIGAASALRTDTKAAALLQALALGFERMVGLGAPRKAIIFTESRRTQDYLYDYLARNGYAGKLVRFSGTNTGEDATRIHQAWLRKNEDTDRVTGSPQVDRRTALIDHFRKMDGSGADVMIATEAAGEGVNLQFCALVINYDLPWNPQRIEQRIGRCHRYGQKFDVVVINFLNTRNYADQRVLQLLTEKFKLFSGVFGSSDEVLGRVESGIDFEKRILGIYDTCRTQDDIEAAFDALQKELEETINERIQSTQAALLENFDQDVHDRLKLRLDEAQNRLDQLGRWFWGVTRHALGGRARFDDGSYAFSLSQPPDGIQAGRYQLIRGARQPDMMAHAYRLNHPLGEWSIARALTAPTPQAELSLDYAGYGARVSVVEKLRGQSGWLRLVHLRVTAFDTTDELLFTGITDAGQALDQDACEKLLGMPATGKPRPLQGNAPALLEQNSAQLARATVARLLEANQRLFVEERDKLERWAEDSILAAEEALKITKARIAELKRESRKAETLQQQDSLQRDIARLERTKRSQRQDIFDVEDDIIDKRDALIDSLQQRLDEKTETQTLFTIRWRLV